MTGKQSARFRQGQKQETIKCDIQGPICTYISGQDSSVESSVRERREVRSVLGCFVPASDLKCHISGFSYRSCTAGYVL